MVILRFYQGKEGPTGAEFIFPFLDKYIANQKFLCADGNRAYLSYYLEKQEREIALFQVSHGQGEFSRKDVLIDIEGNSFTFNFSGFLCDKKHFISKL